MGKLDEIRKKLQSGTTTRKLIEQGYPRSSVYRENKKIKGVQPEIPTSPAPNELQELRHQRDMIKVQKEIAELEAAKGKLPDRITALEKTVVELQRQTIDAVDTAVFISLTEAGWNREKAKEVADTLAEKIIKINQ